MACKATLGFPGETGPPPVLGLSPRADFPARRSLPPPQLLSFSYSGKSVRGRPRGFWKREPPRPSGDGCPGVLGPQLRAHTACPLSPAPQPEAALARKAGQTALLSAPPPPPPFPSLLLALLGHLSQALGVSLQVPPPTHPHLGNCTFLRVSPCKRSPLASVCAKNL